MSESSISKSTLFRLPVYLNYLKSFHGDTPSHISATAIADALELNDVQVRKDLASVSSSGKPKIGYSTDELIKELESFLGCNNTNSAIIVGAGKLGRALMGYNGFREYGMKIRMAFDNDQKLISENESIMPLHRLKEYCKKTNTKIGIITVPAEYAQQVCDLLVESGVLAIWNFSPTHLTVPEGIILQNENIAVSLAVLSNQLTQKIKKDNNQVK